MILMSNLGLVIKKTWEKAYNWLMNWQTPEGEKGNWISSHLWFQWMIQDLQMDHNNRLNRHSILSLLIHTTLIITWNNGHKTLWMDWKCYASWRYNHHHICNWSLWFYDFCFSFISQAVKKSRGIVGFLMQIKFIVEYTVMDLTCPSYGS